MAIGLGSRVGRYEVAAQIGRGYEVTVLLGAGGMGLGPFGD
ncbi:MAG: hypothetical protein ACRD3C_20520 [Vicinamibacterales bacterium]